MLILLLKFLSLDNKISNEINISLLIIVCAPIISLACIHRFSNKKRLSKNINIHLTACSRLLSIYLVLTLTCAIVFSKITEIEQSKIQTERVSLIAADFGFKENGNVSLYINYDRSILGQRIQYSSSNKDNQFNYNIFQSQYTWAVNYYKDRLLSGLNEHGVELKQEDTSLPSNIKVYSFDGQRKEFIVTAKDKVLEITKGFGDISDAEFLKKVYKNFFLNK